MVVRKMLTSYDLDTWTLDSPYGYIFLYTWLSNATHERFQSSYVFLQEQCGCVAGTTMSRTIVSIIFSPFLPVVSRKCAGVIDQPAGSMLWENPVEHCTMYSNFRNYAPPLDEKEGIITEKVFPVFSEIFFGACFGVVM